MAEESVCDLCGNSDGTHHEPTHRAHSRIAWRFAAFGIAIAAFIAAIPFL